MDPDVSMTITTSFGSGVAAMTYLHQKQTIFISVLPKGMNDGVIAWIYSFIYFIVTVGKLKIVDRFFESVTN